MATTIIAELGDHRVYWEPFCGSLAVLFGKPACTMETVNDLHGDLINLARVLKDRNTAEDLYVRLAGVIFHEDLFHEAAERVRSRDKGEPAPGVPDVARAEDYLFVSWFGRNGVAGTSGYNSNFCVRYTANGGHAATRWRSVVGSIPEWHERLRFVTILNRDAFGLLDRIDDAPGTVIYCDPPYLLKGANYAHDFKSDDHDRLAAALRRFTLTRVVVSYYEHPRLAHLYPPDRWSRRTIEVTKALVNQGMRDGTGATKATEVLLANAPLLGIAAERSLFGEAS